MEGLIKWLYSSGFFSFINSIANQTMTFIVEIFENNNWGGIEIYDIDFTLTLFSDTPIFTTNIYDALLLFFSVFYTVIFITIVYKIIKKVFVKITGWKRW